LKNKNEKKSPKLVQSVTWRGSAACAGGFFGSLARLSLERPKTRENKKKKNRENPSEHGDRRRGGDGVAGVGGGEGLVRHDAGVPWRSVLAAGAGGPVARRHGVLPLLAGRRALTPGALCVA